MKRKYAFEIELDVGADQWPTADQIRRALQDALDHLGDLEIEGLCFEVEE